MLFMLWLDRLLDDELKSTIGRLANSLSEQEAKRGFMHSAITRIEA